MKRGGDCAIRAVALALDIDWLDAYDLLAAEGRRQKREMAEVEVIGKVLSDRGFVRHGIKCARGESKPRVSELAARYADSGRAVVCSSPCHVVCCRRGDWGDTWDSGEERVSSYWLEDECMQGMP